MIVVTGGAGFVGTRFCQRLVAAGLPFRIIDKVPSATFPDACTLADVRDPAALRAAIPPGTRAIVHLAAEHRDDVTPRTLYDDVNVQGARHLCDAAEQAGVEAIIFTSSVACYGFAAPETDESGAIRPFNDYGRTKAEAEVVFREWQQRAPQSRALTIVRPTVIFGERNRGNVYNLLNQIARGRFLMVGDGRNCKSMAYVENVAAFLEFCLASEAGVRVVNYIDKPDMTMNELVGLVYASLHRKPGLVRRLPYALGYLIGAAFDVLAMITGRKFPVSRIRVRKFCATTQFASAAAAAGFVPPYTLREGLQRTLAFEFLADQADGPVFYTE